MHQATQIAHRTDTLPFLIVDLNADRGVKLEDQKVIGWTNQTDFKAKEFKATRLTDGHGAMLILPNKDVWNFSAHEDRLEIEESVYLGGLEGPRRTFQIVIVGQARKVGRVAWTLSQTPQPGTSRRSPRA